MPSATTSSARYSRPSNSQAAADAIPILVDDEYHIFHLSTPPDTIRHPPRLRSTWSRLRSNNLVTWKRDDVEPLYPGKTEDAPDADGAWTGSAIVGPDGNMHIFYTGYNLSQDGRQVILHARSMDRTGSAFTKSLSAIAIHGDTSKFEDIDFRDAHVSWNAEENCFWMLVATRLKDGPYWTRGCLALLTSPDLEEWMIESDPFYAPNDMFCPECPELFSLPNGKWYLVYSRFHAPNAGTVYRISDSARGPFRTPRGTSEGRLDARRWYAAKSCPKAGDPNKRMYFGWIADKLDNQWSWGGDMGIPREISADPSGRLIVSPSQPFLDSLFLTCEETIHHELLQIHSVGRTSIEYLPMDQSDYIFSFNIASHNAASFGLCFRTDDDLRGHRLRLVPTCTDAFDMSLVCYPPPLDDFWADQYNLHLPREVDGPEVARHPCVDLKGSIIVMVSANALEIFAGGKSISHRLPRASNTSHCASAKQIRELGVFVEDGDVALTNVSLREGPKRA